MAHAQRVHARVSCAKAQSAEAGGDVPTRFFCVRWQLHPLMKTPRLPKPVLALEAEEEKLLLWAALRI